MWKTRAQTPVRLQLVTTQPAIIKVALNTPLNSLFDYLPPGTSEALQVGSRVKVPFGRREQVGVIAAVAESSELPQGKLRRARELLDQEPLLNEPLVELLNWAARYYQHPPGEVFAAALPTRLRQGHPAELVPQIGWELTDDGSAVDTDTLMKKASAQARLLQALQTHGSQSEAELRATFSGWQRVVKSLAAKNWITAVTISTENNMAEKAVAPTLTSEQQQAVDQSLTSKFQATLLDGVTGSGKTEVYLQLINAKVQEGLQSLVLVPEIGLTPQLVERFRSRVDGQVVVLHSGLNDSKRMEGWLAAQSGRAAVIIGTRSAVFTPLANPGLIIVDEEHDASFKQQDGFRYSARDLAVYRGQQLDVPVILGSATPSLETLNNALDGRYKHAILAARAGNAKQPDIRLIDLPAVPAHRWFKPTLTRQYARPSGSRRSGDRLSESTWLCPDNVVRRLRACRRMSPLRCAYGSAPASSATGLPPLRQRTSSRTELPGLRAGNGSGRPGHRTIGNSPGDHFPRVQIDTNRSGYHPSSGRVGTTSCNGAEWRSANSAGHTDADQRP